MIPFKSLALILSPKIFSNSTGVLAAVSDLPPASTCIATSVATVTRAAVGPPGWPTTDIRAVMTTDNSQAIHGSSLNQR